MDAVPTMGGDTVTGGRVNAARVGVGTCTIEANARKAGYRNAFGSTSFTATQ